LKKSPKELVGYCGIYCGACGIYQGRIKQMVENLQKVIRAWGFDKAAPELAKYDPAFKNYAEFEGVLDGFAKLLGDCPGCIAGGGSPSCVIRQCCKQKNYSTCVECAEMDTCKKLLREVATLENMKRIKALGVGKWAREMQKKVDKGYCQMDEILK
jgi:hypothetical protein